jgi:hypothetical protein
MSIAFPAIVILAGCEQAAPPVEHQEAASQLQSVLTAWKSSQSYESLMQRKPPVFFNEPLWRDGNVLLEFELGDVELFGRQARCTATLFLRDKDGKNFERKIGYQIDTKPQIVIVREGLGP